MNKITYIDITTNAGLHFDGRPMKESIYIHRGDNLHGYMIHATRESFFRCIRAMRRLAIRKWESQQV